MTLIRIEPAARLTGELTVPGDKSISHRAIMIGALARGKTTVNNFLASADCLATIDCLRKLGIRVEGRGTRVEIAGKGLTGLTKPAGPLYVGNSGTTIRLLSGILAGQNWPVEISGDDSIKKRPMGRVARPLREMGADIEGQGSRVKGQEEIYPPLKINGGNLKGINYLLPVASAQVKSAVLLAGLFAAGETSVTEKVASRDHTERMLAHFGAKISVQGPVARVQGKEEFDAADVEVPGDISSAAFFLVAGLIIPNSELRITNVGVNPTRTGIIDVLHRMGADLTVENERIDSEEPRADLTIRSSQLKAIKLDGAIIPRIIDEIPIIAVAATQAEGVTEIRGAKELRVKESDRLKTTAAELRKMGAQIEELPDGLRITGPTKLRGTMVESYGDHRIAMAAAVAGLIAEGDTVVNNTDCIETSFPGFEKLLKSLR
ncbi:MAG: 3-phosphoshikimate 1-carboxyvinyltransferase [Candidatus Margulisbacteria bacterium]|jgi:3-phosphoshikimate 1-carboxyvinyltransferase|nr:3-phosphoshikimate 1-carboxyvinyltransferase [Candidatus Margulisiibacteriota bacterium]